MADASVRLDIFLWHARFAKARKIAQDIAQCGHVRLDGRTIDKAGVAVRPGSVLAFPLNGRVRVVRVERLPTRRGPPGEAAMLYTDLAPVDGGGGTGIGQAAIPDPTEG